MPLKGWFLTLQKSRGLWSMTSGDGAIPRVLPRASPTEDKAKNDENQQGSRNDERSFALSLLGARGRCLLRRFTEGHVVYHPAGWGATGERRKARGWCHLTRTLTAQRADSRNLCLGVKMTISMSRIRRLHLVRRRTAGQTIRYARRKEAPHEVHGQRQPHLR